VAARSSAAPTRVRPARRSRPSRSRRSCGRARCAGAGRSRASTRTAARVRGRRAASRSRSPPSRPGSRRSRPASRRAPPIVRPSCQTPASAARVGGGVCPVRAPLPSHCRGAHRDQRTDPPRHPSLPPFRDGDMSSPGGAYRSRSRGARSKAAINGSPGPRARLDDALVAATSVGVYRTTKGILTAQRRPRRSSRLDVKCAALAEN
jgi:hypothetical protein